MILVYSFNCSIFIILLLILIIYVGKIHFFSSKNMNVYYYGYHVNVGEVVF